ncbi:hypothetical protein QQS21_010474 [Conoideocrella luteorostrata]|uniref:Xylose isomerase-like TIM barrel domain-containing protein n=1 Tax=Conoideocrella luteorostrata TaxID=1105319 RepID=A0AAJ0CF91_9HYPO|nr:hypothetical protein QQS21_010474 [Conoideocrella luteorostrata]
MSLGAPDLPLMDKLIAAREVGFLGVEMYMEDLVEFAKWRVSEKRAISAAETTANADDAPALRGAARHVRSMCDKLSLKVVSLQPFRNFDGLTDPALRAQSLQLFELWLEIAEILGADLIGVPATLPTADNLRSAYTDDPQAAANDLKLLAAMAKPYGIQVAYENLCFSAHVQDWEQAWERIQLACADGKTDNLVFLQDTFNFCGKRYIDTDRPSGVRVNGDENLQHSLERLLEELDMTKMPLFQIADAECMGETLTKDHPWRRDSGHGALMALSRNGRLFPLEEGAYLPVSNIAKAMAEKGWSGWVSMEIFARNTAKDGRTTIFRHADRAWASWERLATELGWQVKSGRMQGVRSNGR